MLETKKHNLISCPTCESQGFKSILGELGTAGEFIVQRFHQGYTIIKAPLVSIVCGRCSGTAYFKHEREVHVEGVGVYSLSIQGTNLI